VRRIRLTIISDPVCPWCFIGKARLDAALAQRPAALIEPFWSPYALNPDMPAAGMDRKAYTEGKFGGADGAARVYGAIASAAEADGLALALDRIERQPNSTDASRLIRWAQRQGRGHAAAQAVFAAWFQQGRDIGDATTLAAIAEEIGADGSAARAHLDSGADVAETIAEAARWRALGVDGVPAYIIGDLGATTGAQPAAFWLSVIDRLAARAGQEV
jgi:predicted DsbA family dithiol-disulfide isomerase